MTNNTSEPKPQDVQGVVERPSVAERLIVLIAMDNAELALEVERYIDRQQAALLSEHEGRVRAERGVLAEVRRGEERYRLNIQRQQRAERAEAALASSQARVEALLCAISWIEPPFVDDKTSPEELRKRVAFLLADVAKATALKPTGAAG